MTQTQEVDMLIITKETIKEIEEQHRKFVYLQDFYKGFPSKAFPNGGFTENQLRRLAKKQGTTFDSLVDKLYEWTEGKSL